ncbi:MgtC/SapB family protein [uncultured Ilyobacter sp.]|uniref:MgtC/SapB family protein n=1 Tax=uncultured Ilyobacter sp. TaxID=544433 RepID=UPI0029C001E6|nr:MgtC/SapB family protein [uncultured Ilyobacter sp.]
MERYMIDEWEIVLRVCSALLAGGIIGWERERRGKAAGFVTNMLVCVGAATITAIQVLVIRDSLELIASDPNNALVFKSDLSRMTAQIISGVGFLGAGAIIHEKGSIKGITTAAIIWVVAAIGIAFGMGFYFLGTIVTLIVFFVIYTLKKAELNYISKRNANCEPFIGD